MLWGTTTRRRWLGTTVLVAALVMLVAGETTLKSRLGPVAQLLYWLGCLALTVTAIVVALADARAARREIHREEQDLLQATLNEIGTKAKARGQGERSSGPSTSAPPRNSSPGDRAPRRT